MIYCTVFSHPPPQSCALLYVRPTDSILRCVEGDVYPYLTCCDVVAAVANGYRLSDELIVAHQPIHEVVMIQSGSLSTRWTYLR